MIQAGAKGQAGLVESLLGTSLDGGYLISLKILTLSKFMQISVRL